MNAKLYPFIALIAGILWVAGCAHKPSAGSGRTSARQPLQRLIIHPPSSIPSASPTPPEPTVPPVPEVHRRDQQAPAGSYAASYLTGDYAGYPALERFIDRMVSRHGYSREYLYGLFSQAQRKQWTLDYLGREPTRPSGAPPRPGSWSRYRAKFLTEKHISTGAAFWNRHAAALQRASAQYGVSPEHIMGIMGVETIYGGNVGNHRVIDALTTLAFDYPRRSTYFTEELENFLIMTRDEGMDPSEPVGSYAGAMGLGQFMPSSFLHFAVDFDGDGRRNLWDPEDAIGSIANYFAGHGWHSGQPVVAPAIAGSAARGLECGLDKRYPLASLADYGIRPTVSYPAESVRLLRLSAEAGDEYWVGYDNFYVITRYNHSTHYAMAVHQLAEAVKQRYMRLAAR
jgi:membrane-bound lytic murein transglycosylase B